MNLLYTLTAYPPSTGGAQLLMHQIARQLSSRHSVQVVTQWDSNRTDWLLGTTLRLPALACSYEVDGIPVERISLPANVRRQLIPWVLAYYPLQGPALARISAALTREIEPWAAHANLVHNCRIGREGLSFASFQVAHKYGIPFVLTPVHHPRWSGWRHRYYHQLYRQADAVIALTEAERRELVRLGVAEEKVFVTGMGPVLAEDGVERRFRDRYQLGEESLILFLGQKYEYKGMAALLAAVDLVWQQFQETRFVFIGPRTAYSRRLFKAVADRRLLELDTVPLQEKTDALAACTLLCVPSSQESFGGVYTEAWSFARPVIGCNIPAVAEVISDGVDGFLVEQQPAQIADRIIQLLHNPGRAQAMGEAGRRKVADRYAWEQLALRTEQVYQEVVR
jgi:glycosyltransferase involved in cell wall biosynthesis